MRIPRPQHIPRAVYKYTFESKGKEVEIVCDTKYADHLVNHHDYKIVKKEPRP